MLLTVYLAMTCMLRWRCLPLELASQEASSHF